MSFHVDYLREILHYNPDTGNFHGKKNNRIAGCKSSMENYWRIKIDGREYRRARLAWLYMTGEWPIDQIDHKNRNSIDDRWVNLRESTQNQNQRNRKSQINKKSKLPKWVFKSGNRYKVEIKHNKKILYFGQYKTPEEAYNIAKLEAKKLHGEFYFEGNVI